MDNISGKANYDSDHDLAMKKLKTKVKKNIKTKSSTTVNAMLALAVDLQDVLKNEYVIVPNKKISDAVISTQSVIDVLENIE